MLLPNIFHHHYNYYTSTLNEASNEVDENERGRKNINFNGKYFQI